MVRASGSYSNQPQTNPANGYCFHKRATDLSICFSNENFSPGHMKASCSARTGVDISIWMLPYCSRHVCFISRSSSSGSKCHQRRALLIGLWLEPVYQHVNIYTYTRVLQSEKFNYFLFLTIMDLKLIVHVFTNIPTTRPCFGVMAVFQWPVLTIVSNEKYIHMIVILNKIILLCEMKTLFYLFFYLSRNWS